MSPSTPSSLLREAGSAIQIWVWKAGKSLCNCGRSRRCLGCLWATWGAPVGGLFVTSVWAILALWGALWGNFGIAGRSLGQLWHFGAIIGGHSLRVFEKHFLFNFPVFTTSVLLRLATFLAVCGQHGGLRWEGFLLRLCGQFWHCGELFGAILAFRCYHWGAFFEGVWKAFCVQFSRFYYLSAFAAAGSISESVKLMRLLMWGQFLAVCGQTLWACPQFPATTGIMIPPTLW